MVAAVNGAEIRHGRGTFDGILELVAGTAALGFAAGLHSGRVQRRPRREPSPEPSQIARRLRDPHVAVAATAGIATHLPGLFYIVALNSILAEHDGEALQIVAVTVFNAIWWSTPVATLVLFILSPHGTRDLLARVNAWARRHQRPILTGIFAGVGAYLVVKGTAELLS